MEEIALPIEFKISRDPQLLSQYYALREQCFRKELKLPDFDGSEEESDRQGQIFLAVQDGRCVGGARISSRLVAQEYHHELDLQPETSCVWERSILDPTIRTTKIFRDFCYHLVESSRMLGYRHALIFSSLLNARFYRQCHAAMGIGFNIHGSVPECAQGAFTQLEHYLSVSQLENRHLQLAKPVSQAA
jgi:hypothetical protein